jgi:hypothetical protein
LIHVNPRISAEVEITDAFQIDIFTVLQMLRIKLLDEVLDGNKPCG